MSAITITTAPTLIAAHNPNRIDLIITNASTGVVYIGGNNSVAVGNTIYLRQNDVFIDDYSCIKGYRGEVWGVVSTGTSVINTWERSQ